MSASLPPRSIPGHFGGVSLAAECYPSLSSLVLVSLSRSREQTRKHRREWLEPVPRRPSGLAPSCRTATGRMASAFQRVRHRARIGGGELADGLAVPYRTLNGHESPLESNIGVCYGCLDASQLTSTSCVTCHSSSCCCRSSMAAGWNPSGPHSFRMSKDSNVDP